MEVYSSRKSSNNSISPERKMVWIESNKARAKERKVAVVYYLTRNGHFEHPHFMEVPIPSGQGLYLRDVIKRFNSLRGQGMAGMYSWSSKRSYKNSFVWQDLSEDDFIYPSHGNEYILKGSQILHFDVSSFMSQDEASQTEDIPNEYTVYKNKQTAETEAIDACTQTEDIIRNSHVIKEQQQENEEILISELSRDDISPPSSTSSSETMEAIIKADGSIVPISNEIESKNGGGVFSTSRKKLIRSPSALMQLLACGSVSVKEKGFSLVSQFKGRVPRAIAREEEIKDSSLENKEYFSGSLVELKKKHSSYENREFSGLRRSSSCNAERGLKMDLAVKEIEGVEARCIPRRLKTATIASNIEGTKKEHE